MSKYKVTFIDVIEAEDVVEAYEQIRQMCADMGDDVTPFEFEEVTE